MLPWTESIGCGSGQALSQQCGWIYCRETLLVPKEGQQGWQGGNVTKHTDLPGEDRVHSGSQKLLEKEKDGKWGSGFQLHEVVVSS